MIYQLNPDNIDFPDPRDGEEDGIFDVGGDLEVDRLLLAYSNGIFPWYAFRKEDNVFCDENGDPWIQWWCPMKRFVIFPDEIHISHSMRSLIRKERYQFSFNQAFDKVIGYCGQLRIDERGAWLGPHIVDAYTKLHKLGFVASVEVWDKMPDANATPKGKEDVEWYYNEKGYRLVGGLYGITLGTAFIGESMFSLIPNGSKLALIFLAKYLQSHGGQMIDCQIETPHLQSMGGRFISYDEYMNILRPEKDEI